MESIGIVLAALAVFAFVGLHKSATAPARFSLDPDAPESPLALEDVARVVREGGTIAVQLLDLQTHATLPAILNVAKGSKINPKDGRFRATYRGPVFDVADLPQPIVGAPFLVAAKNVLSIHFADGTSAVPTSGKPPSPTSPTGIPPIAEGGETVVDSVEGYAATAAFSPDGSTLEISNTAPSGDFDALEIRTVPLPEDLTGKSALAGILVASRKGTLYSTPIDLKDLGAGPLPPVDLSCGPTGIKKTDAFSIEIACGPSTLVAHVGFPTSIKGDASSYSTSVALLDARVSASPAASINLSRHVEKSLGLPFLFP